MANVKPIEIELTPELKALGAPTFQEFVKNRDKWMGKDDEKLGLADTGSQILKKHVKKHIYEIEGYRCKNLEEVERVAKSQGIPVSELDYRPEIMPMSGRKCDILVKFVPKHTRDKRETW